MSQFFKLKVAEIRRETVNAVSIKFNLSSDLKEKFSFKSGQYITLKHIVNDEEIIRSYSLCGSSIEDDFRIGVKEIDGGVMSAYLNKDLKVGEYIEVMIPEGRFYVEPDSKNKNRYVAVVGGSGITPVLSILKTILAVEKQSVFELYYSNKNPESVMFKDELLKLEKQYKDRFIPYYIYTQIQGEVKLLNGRVTKERFVDLMLANPNGVKADEFFVCGPEEMMLNVIEGLKVLGVDKEKVKYELFGTPSERMKIIEGNKKNKFKGMSKIELKLDDEDFSFDLLGDDVSILDAAIDNDIDVPYSCRGAVCSTCKAKVLEGDVVMEMNYSLSDEEVAEGYVLTCQSHPSSEKVKIDYDVD